VAKGSAGVVRLRHPVVVDLELNYEDLAPLDDPDEVLRVFSAKPGSPSSDSLQLLGSFGAEGVGAVRKPSQAVDTDASPSQG
jgi:hypothetical protein